MKILALEHEVPGIDPELFTPLLKSEALRVLELYQSGLVREIYFKQDVHEAVLVLECSNKEEAEGILHSLPLVLRGLITFEVIPLVPYPVLTRLFTINEDHLPGSRPYG